MRIFIVFSIANVFLLVILNSCSWGKEEEFKEGMLTDQLSFAKSSEGNEQVQAYLDFVNGYYDGLILLHQETSLPQPLFEVQNVYAKMYAQPKADFYEESGLVCSHNVQLNGFDMFCSSDEPTHLMTAPDRKALMQKGFGTEIPLIIKNLSGEEDVNEIFYNPANFHPNDFRINGGNSATLNTSTVLSWSPDPLNTRDLVLILDYRPNCVPFADSLNATVSYPGRKTYIKAISDNGEYRFTDEDLSMYENGMTAQLSLIRGNYTTLAGQNSNKVFALATYSMLTHFFVVRK